MGHFHSNYYRYHLHPFGEKEQLYIEFYHFGDLSEKYLRNLATCSPFGAAIWEGLVGMASLQVRF